jgi:hypothetical protein
MSTREFISLPTTSRQNSSTDLGDKDNKVTYTNSGSKTGLDVNVINMGSLIPVDFDDIAITYDVISGKKVASIVEYYSGGLSGDLVATLTLSYDGSADLIKVVRT